MVLAIDSLDERVVLVAISEILPIGYRVHSLPVGEVDLLAGLASSGWFAVRAAVKPRRILPFVAHTAFGCHGPKDNT
jgi:hypothetical protein